MTFDTDRHEGFLFSVTQLLPSEGHRGPAACPAPPPPIPLRRPAPGPGGGAACHAPHLVLAAFARLQTGEDLALDGLDPRVPLLVRGGFEVPRLAREGHNDELEVFFLFWNTGGWGSNRMEERM